MKPLDICEMQNRIIQLEQEISNLQNEVNEARQAEQDADKELNTLKGKLDNTFLIPGATVREIKAQAIEDMTRQVTAFIVETGEYSTAFVITKDDVRDHIQRLREDT